jgi:hypothetical protein
MHRVTGATLTRLRVLPTEAGNTKGTGDGTGGTTAAGASGSGTVGKLSQLVGFGKFFCILKCNVYPMFHPLSCSAPMQLDLHKHPSTG